MATYLTVSDILEDSENSDSVGLAKAPGMALDPMTGVLYDIFVDWY